MPRKRLIVLLVTVLLTLTCGAPSKNTLNDNVAAPASSSAPPGAQQPEMLWRESLVEELAAMMEQDWEISEKTISLYDFIKKDWGDYALRRNLKEAIDRDLTLEQILLHPEKFYSTPIVFTGLVADAKSIEVGESKSTLVGLLVLDGTYKHIVMVLSVQEISVQAGTPAVVIGYLGPKSLKLKKEMAAVVVARSILPLNEAMRYILR